MRRRIMASRKSRRKTEVFGFVASVVALAVVATLTAGGAGAGPQGVAAVPRGQTLYTSGKQWGPYTNFNPLKPDYNTGVVGLVYETLFRYDPLKDRFIPWLASGGKWVGRNYVVTVRSGVKWSDGKPLTAADVKFTFETQKNTGAQYGTMWKTGLTRITTRGRTVTFRFRGVPNYQEWDSNRYTVPIVPRHIFRAYSAKELVSGNASNTRRIVGTGPFTYGGGAGGSQTFAVEQASELVGHEGPRNEDADEAHRRHPQHVEHGVAAELPAKPDRPEQQLLPRDQQARGRQGRHLLQAGAVHARRQHGVARAQPDQAAAQRRHFPQGTRRVDQHQQDRRRRLPADRVEGQPDRPAPDVEQVDQPGAGPEPRLQLQHLEGEESTFTGRIQGPERRRLRRGQGRIDHQPPADRPERLVGLGDGDPNHRRQRQGRRHQDHAGLSGLQRPRRRAQHGQVRARDQQREADRQHAVHLLRLSVPTADPGVADGVQLPAVLVAADLGALSAGEQGPEHERCPGEEDPLADPAGDPHAVARDSALVQRHVGAVQHDALDELPDLQWEPGDAVDLERLPQHDGHRRPREVETQVGLHDQ